jgi:hypothetical protein
MFEDSITTACYIAFNDGMVCQDWGGSNFLLLKVFCCILYLPGGGE